MGTAVTGPVPQMQVLSFSSRARTAELAGARLPLAAQRAVASRDRADGRRDAHDWRSPASISRSRSPPGLFWSYLTAATLAVGLVWWQRRPGEPVRAAARGVRGAELDVSWEASDWPLIFDLGVLVEAPAWLLTIYVFLAFPMGRIEPRAARWLMWGLGLGALFTFLPWALLSPVIAGGGPLSGCAPDCPANALQIGSDPKLAEVAGKAETYIALTLAAAVLVVYVDPAAAGVEATAPGAASRSPSRRSCSCRRGSSFTFSAWILELDLQTLETMAWVIVGTRILLPLGFLVALLQAEHFAGRALRVLLRAARREAHARAVARLGGRGARRPGAEARLQRAGDRRFREASGDPLTPAAVKSHQAWVAVDRDDEPVAAMVIDEALTADPELVRAAASATLLAVENGALEGELRASRARIVEAGHAERRRIERDLHDGAQQRLVALRMHLSLVGEQLGGSRELESLGVEVDEAIHELRNLAHGVYPQLLAQAGVGSALMAVGRRSGMPVRVYEHGLSRHAEPVEITVYFCCVEGLQNAAKHAGPGRP